jgi:hypothetical protein
VKVVGQSGEIVEAPLDSKLERIMKIDDEAYDPHFTHNQIVQIKKRGLKKEKLLKRKERNAKPDDSSDDDVIMDLQSKKFIIKEDVKQTLSGVKRAAKDEPEADTLGTLESKLRSI